MYLSTTDYVQHKVGLGTRVANDFYAMIDGYLAQARRARLQHRGDRRSRHERQVSCRTANRTMLYLQDVMDGWTGQGEARVILPITDPYVAHHGSLGSFATIYTPRRPLTSDALLDAASRHQAASTWR